MKHAIIISGLLFLMSLSLSTQTKFLHSDSKHFSEDLKAKAINFLIQSFNEGDPSTAWDNYISSDYIQHHPNAKDDKNTWVGFINTIKSKNRDTNINIRQIFAQENKVIIFQELQAPLGSDSNLQTYELVDIFKFNDQGKISENWDIEQLMNYSAVPQNNNGVFGNIAEIKKIEVDSKKVELNVLKFINTAFNVGDPKTAVAMYIGDSYTQHNPTVPDGKDGFINYFIAAKQAFPDIKVNPKSVIVQGDRVAVHSEAYFPTATGKVEPFSVVDVFRVDNEGLIVEHWDASTPVPPQNTNPHGMF